MKLSSNDFEDGGEIPEKFSCNGEGARPNLNWSEVPTVAKSLAISLVDLDAPSGNFVHWIVADIPISTSAIESNEEVSGELPNTTGKVAYVPPCPHSGKHRYVFTLYVLDIDQLDQEASKNFFVAIKPHIIEEAKFSGYYQKRVVV